MCTGTGICIKIFEALISKVFLESTGTGYGAYHWVFQNWYPVLEPASPIKLYQQHKKFRILQISFLANTRLWLWQLKINSILSDFIDHYIVTLTPFVKIIN